MKRFFRWWPIGFILVTWFVFAHPYFLKGLMPFPSKYLVTFFPPWSAAWGMPVKNNAMPDVITQIYPWKRLTIETWKSGQVPLWNPYAFAGTPQAANYQSAVFSPANLLFFALPEIEAWSMMILLQPLLAGLFMYAFLRELKRSQEGSLIGSLAFMFCGFMVVWMAYGTLGYAALPLPLILLSLQRLFTKPSWWWRVFLAVSLAMSFVSGHFQIGLYVLAAALAYLLFLGFASKRWRVVVEAAPFLLLGLFLAAPQLLPSYEAFVNSVRQTSFGKGEVIPWQYLITLMAPDFFGNPVTRNDWFGHYAEWASYIGVAPLLLAVFALFLKKKKEEWFFGGMATIALLLATPTPLNDLLYRIRFPVLSTSGASRIVVLASFALATLSAYGFDGLVVEWKKADKSRWAKLVVLVGWLTAAIWVFLQLGRGLPVDKLIVAKRNMILPTALALGALTLGIAGFWRLPRVILAGAVIVLVSFDLLRFASKWMPFDPKEYVYPKMPVINFLQSKAGVDRVFGNFGGELAVSATIQSIEGYDALYPRRYGEFIASASRGALEPASRSVALLNKGGMFAEDLLQLLGVRYYLHRLSDGRNIWAYPFWTYPYYRSVYRDEYYEVLENPAAYPRAFLASSYLIAKKDEEIIRTLWLGGLDRQETVVLEREPHILPQPGEGRVDVVSYQPTEVVLAVETDAPKLLFVSDTYANGWQAGVDGEKTPVYRANYAFRAVGIPAGSHTVRLFYQPRGFVQGVWLAGVATLILVMGSVKAIYEDRFR